MVLIKAILGQIRVFWSKSSDIWYILESKIQEYYWISAQKFKLDDLRSFRQNSIFGPKYDFWHSVCIHKNQ